MELLLFRGQQLRPESGVKIPSSGLERPQLGDPAEYAVGQVL
jgi:hypothetical protein